MAKLKSRSSRIFYVGRAWPKEEIIDEHIKLTYKFGTHVFVLTSGIIILLPITTDIFSKHGP